MDVKTIFSNENLGVYINQLKGFWVERKKYMVCEFLKKLIYRLKQAFK